MPSVFGSVVVTAAKVWIPMSTLLPNRPTWSTSLLLSTTCAVLSWSAAALGQTEPDAATVGAARSLAIEGVKLADAGDCQAALAPLRKAEGLYHSHIVASRLGECEINTGKLVEGTERLRKLLRETPPENPSAAVQRAFSQAQLLVDQTIPKLAGIKIAIVGPDLDTVTVKVNGTLVMAAALGVEFPVNPGSQEVTVEASDFFPQSETVTLAPGQKHTVSLDLEPRPRVAEAEAPAANSETHSASLATVEPVRAEANPDVRDTGSTSYAPAYVSYAIGLIGLGVGAGYGYAAKSDHDALAERCPNKLCPSDQSGALEDAKSKGTIATIGLGVGAVGVVVGTIYLLVSGGDEPQSAASPPTGGVAFQPWFGSDQLGVAAKF
jgi:hypothetical protein